jgi:endonuclease/exonuclease/phosphatase family metal-dependent hydrolase
MVPARPSEAPAVDPFCQVVEIDVDGRTLTLYNVHLGVTEVWNYLGPGASFGEGIRGSFETREQQAQRILEDIDRGQGLVMVVGDFNMTPQTDAYRMLARRLKDAHREAGHGFGHTFPAHGGRFFGIPYPRRVVRIDLILYSPDWVAQEARVLHEHGRSDHMPVWARLAWSQ